MDKSLPRSPLWKGCPVPSMKGYQHSVGSQGWLCPNCGSWLRSSMACPVFCFASPGHHGHVPGAGCQHIPAGVPRCGQGQGERRDDDLLPQWRAPAKLAAASSGASSLASRGTGRLLCVPRGQVGSLRSSPVVALGRFPTLTRKQPLPLLVGVASGLALGASVLRAPS